MSATPAPPHASHVFEPAGDGDDGKPRFKCTACGVGRAWSTAVEPCAPGKAGPPRKHLSEYVAEQYELTAVVTLNEWIEELRAHATQLRDGPNLARTAEARGLSRPSISVRSTNDPY